ARSLMRFHLSEEQELFQDSIRRAMLENCSGPARRAMIEGDANLNSALWATIADLGIAGMITPEEFGGAGLSVLDAALAAETLGECAAPAPVLRHLLASYALSRSQANEQKQEWLPRLAGGQARAAFAFAGGWRPED